MHSRVGEAVGRAQYEMNILVSQFDVIFALFSKQTQINRVQIHFNWT